MSDKVRSHNTDYASIMSRQSSGGNGTDIRRRNCQSKPSTWGTSRPDRTHTPIFVLPLSPNRGPIPVTTVVGGAGFSRKQNDILRADHPTPSFSILPNIPYKYCTSNAGYAACAHLPYPAAVIFNSGLDATAGILTYMSRSSNNPTLERCLGAQRRGASCVVQALPALPLQPQWSACVACCALASLGSETGGEQAWERCACHHRERVWHGWHGFSVPCDARCHA